ncbi:hypothetical protein AB0454_26030 [Streptomyces sp. NPDC093509]|uniref:hypothetical protein n=1 Tax=Streptomyces sp. NPDC093509 TaxID=3154982 RepID=UPI00344C18B3
MSGGRATLEETAAPNPEDAPDAGREGARRWPVYTGLAVVVLALLAGGIVWLFQDELFKPFGDARACEGSTTELPQVISAGGVPLPADASDVHYATREGTAQVSFLSDRMPDYLHRAGLLPQDAKPFDEQYGGAYGLATDEGELPKGLCGPALKGPAWSYITRGPGSPVNVLIERSPVASDLFRSPARAVVTFDIT